MITFSDFKINLKKRWKSVVFLANLALFLGLGLSLIQPFLYRTSFSILIVQDTKEATNIYSSVESSDKLASLLQKMIKTSDFQNSIMNSGFNINKDDFSSDEATKRKQWNKMISANIVPGSGIINFNVYYKNKSGAEEYAKAIVSSIVNDGAQIYGGSSLIKFKVINSPLTSNRPATPNIFLNGALSILIGFMASVFYVYFTTTEAKKRDVFYDEELENEKENVDKKYITSISNSDISVLPNAKINNTDKEESQDIIKDVVIEEKNIEKNDTGEQFITQIETKNEVIEKNAPVNENNDIKVIYEEDNVPNVGFLKNVNDRVKSVINSQD